MSATPHYPKIPTDPAAHAGFRLDLYRRAARSRSLRALLLRWCEEDMLFYLGCFGWTYAPVLHPECPTWPALLWSCQNQALLELSDAIDRQEDVKFKKSRDMGATWLCLWVMEWRARFRRRESFGVMSRNEEYVDSDNEDALMPKLDFMHEEQRRATPWLFDRNEIERKDMSLRYRGSGGSIFGQPTTGDAFRGGRKTAILLDEYNAFSLNNGYLADSATLHATGCRIFNFTSKGQQGAAWELDRKPGVRTISLWWWQHPHKADGEYASDGTRPAPDYRGKRRSPWYDRMCGKAINPKDILAELDGEWVGSSDAFFPSDLVDGYQEKYCLAPYFTGELFHDDRGQPDELRAVSDGPWQFWFHPISEEGRLVAPEHEFAVAVDVAAGTGRSDSVLVVGDKVTGEKIAQYVNNRILPHALACKAAAAARFFRSRSGEPAQVIWEDNGGPGANFRDGLMGAPVGFGHVYYRRDPRGSGYKTTDKPGYHASTRTQRTALEAYKTALIRERFIDRSRETLQEARLYIYDGDAVVHPASRRKEIDPSGAGVNHGDRVRATALLWHIMGDPVRRRLAEPKRKIPMDSLWGRRQKIRKAQREAAYGVW